MLDTHAWIWWVANPEQISQAAMARIGLEVEEGGIYVSTISSWEISLLVKKGRLALTLEVADWIARTEALPFVHFVPIDNRIALRSNSLPGDFHDDPADRLIVATALTLGAPLVTRDARIQAYLHVETLW